MASPRKARFWLILGCWTALALLFGAQIQLINTRILGGSGSWSEALAWLLLGFAVYFGYGIRHSRLRARLPGQ